MPSSDHHAESGYGLFMATGPDEFLGAGKGFRVLFTATAPTKTQLAIASIDEGTFEDGKWVRPPPQWRRKRPGELIGASTPAR